MLFCDFKMYSDMAANFFMAASQLIALKWKDETPPMEENWVSKMCFFPDQSPNLPSMT